MLDISRRVGTTLWSDLRVVHGFWQTPSRLAACPSCDVLLCKDAAEEVGVLPSSTDEMIHATSAPLGWRRWISSRGDSDLLERYRAAPPVKPLSLTRIEGNLTHAETIDEVDLRLQLWRFHNDARRGNTPNASLPSDFRVNIERILALLQPHDETQRLLAAELNRQLGQFHAAMNHLSRIQSSLGREKAAMMSWVIEGSDALQVFY